MDWIPKGTKPKVSFFLFYFFSIAGLPRSQIQQFFSFLFLENESIAGLTSIYPTNLSNPGGNASRDVPQTDAQNTPQRPPAEPLGPATCRGNGVPSANHWTGTVGVKRGRRLGCCRSPAKSYSLLAGDREIRGESKQ